MTRLISQQRNVHLLASWTSSLRVEWGSTIDPTAITPQFLLTAATVKDPPTVGWVNGEWAEDYGATRIAWTAAHTPLIGSASAAFRLTSGSSYRLWMRVAGLGGEDLPLLCGGVFCR